MQYWHQQCRIQNIHQRGGGPGNLKIFTSVCESHLFLTFCRGAGATPQPLRNLMESIAISMRLIPPRICIHNFYNDYHTSHQVKPFRSLIVNLFAIELIHIPRQGKHFKILTAPCRSFCVGYLYGKMNQSRSYEPSTTNKNDIANPP